MPETWFQILKLKRGVPEDGPASKDENYSSGKGKDKKIESESKLTKVVIMYLKKKKSGAWDHLSKTLALRSLGVKSYFVRAILKVKRK